MNSRPTHQQARDAFQGYGFGLTDHPGHRRTLDRVFETIANSRRERAADLSQPADAEAEMRALAIKVIRNSFALDRATLGKFTSESAYVNQFLRERGMSLLTEDELQEYPRH